MPKYQPEEYWEKRSLQRLTSAEKSSIQYLKKIHNTYRSAARSVVNTVKETYASYYRNDEKFNMELLEEIEPRGNITKFMNDMAKAGLNTSLPENFKGRMSRLRMLEAQLWAESKKVALREDKISTASYKNTLVNSYYRTIYDVLQGTGTNSAFSTLNQKTIDKILETKFEGSNYSERIWKNTDVLANSLQDILARAVATGQEPEKTAREIMQRFDVGFSNASRLVRTETNYFENKGELESYKELGIKKFKFLATLDERTSDICRSMDSKVFSVKEAEQGKNVPPLHPYCRSTIVPVVEGWEPDKRSAMNEEGEMYQVPGNMNYTAWRKTLNNSPKIRATNIVSEFISRGVKVLPNTRIMREAGATLNNSEQLMVDWAAEHIGGEIRILKTSDKEGIEMPDLNINRKKVEIKTTSGTLNTLDAHVRKAASQTQKGTAMININGAEYSNREAIEAITHRMNRSGLKEVYLFRGKRLIKHIVNK